MRSIPAIFLSVMIVVSGCGQKRLPVPTADQLSEFAHATGLTFPDTAKPVAWHEERSPNGVDGLWLKVVLPQADLQAFLAGSPFQDKPFSTQTQYGASLFGLFETAPATGGKASFATLPNGAWLVILMDENDGQATTIYLMCQKR